MVQTSTPDHIRCMARSVGTWNAVATVAGNHLLGMADGEETPVRGRDWNAARWSGPDGEKPVGSHGAICGSNLEGVGAANRWTIGWPTNLKYFYKNPEGQMIGGEDDHHGDNGDFSGMSIYRWRLNPSRTPRKVYWALRVIKLYLHGERHGYIPAYPPEV